MQQGTDEDATVLIGRTGLPDGLNSGYFVTPTVFADVMPDRDAGRNVQINYPAWGGAAPFGGYNQFSNERDYADFGPEGPRCCGHWVVRPMGRAGRDCCPVIRPALPTN